MVVEVNLPTQTAPVDPTALESMQANTSAVDVAPAPQPSLPPAALDAALPDVACVDGAAK